MTLPVVFGRNLSLRVVFGNRDTLSGCVRPAGDEPLGANAGAEKGAPVDALSGCVRPAGDEGEEPADEASDAEGDAGDLEVQQDSTPVTMWRLYNPNSGEHFYTSNLGERDHIVSVGWRLEGVGWAGWVGAGGTAGNAGQRVQNALNALGGYDVGFVVLDLNSGFGIARSSTAARYAALRQRYGSGPMQRLMNWTGVHSFSSSRDFVYYSPRDLAKLWVGCYRYFYVPSEGNGNAAWCRSLYTEGLTGGNAFIHNALAGQYTVHAKPGWRPGKGYNAQNDAGIVMAGDNPYVVVVLSSACGRYDQLSELVRALDAAHAELVS